MSAPTVQQALALYKHAYEQGQLAEAEGYLRQALAISRTEQGDRRDEMEILIDLGPVAKEQGNISMGRDFLQEALRIAEEEQDRHREAMIRIFLGDVGHAVQDRRWIDDARYWYEGALTIMRELHDHEGAARSGG